MRYLVDFHHNTSQSDIDSYLVTNGCTVLKEWDNFDKVYLVECDNAPPKTELTEYVILEQEQGIQLLDATPVYTHFQSHTDSDYEKIVCDTSDTKDWWKNYSYVEPKFEGTLEISRFGKNINVYVLDSGIEASHPEFVDATIENIYSVVPGNFNDYTGHGTAISSVIAGKTCGITDATIKVVKIFDPNHQTMLSEMLSALDAIIANHNPNTFGVVNCSWIIEKNEWVESKLSALVNMGLFVIAAAGNQGTEIENVTPASMPLAMTVGAYNRDLKPCDFSNYTGGSLISVTSGQTNHGELDGWAPGEEIWAAGLNGGYGYVAGTSIAAGITSAITVGYLYWYTDDQGHIMPAFEDFVLNSSVTGSPNEIFRRFNLLDFDDPKYASSKNQVATIASRHLSPISQPIDDIHIAIYAGQKKICARVMEPVYTTSIEFIDALPANFEILPDGRIWGTPTLEQGPTGDEEYKTYVCKFNRTNTSNETELVTVTINILKPGLDPNQGGYPPDHPINILLQNVCVGNLTQCNLASFNTCPTLYCSFGCCNPTFGKSASCTCA
jgi:hypothetical protein